MSATVVFNVGGQRFEVLRQTIERHEDTLLACLVADLDTDASEPIFVDANPERFQHILDWYRYGEVFLASGCNSHAVLRDARFFLLPDEIVVNGVAHLVGTAAQAPPVAGFDVAMKGIADTWKTFESYVDQVVAQANKTWASTADDSNTVEDAYRDYPKAFSDIKCLTHEVSLFSAGRWVDEQNVCNRHRLQLLVHELTRRGFECSLVNLSVGGIVLRMSTRTATGTSDTAQAVRLVGVAALNGGLVVGTFNVQGPGEWVFPC